MKKSLWIHILIIIAALLFVCYFTSCKTPPPSKSKTEYINKYIRDSIYSRDSIFMDRWRNGDTIFQNKEVYVYRYKDKLVRDTTHITDTIYVQVKGDPIEVNRLKWYQEASVWFTSAVLVLLLLYLGIKHRSKIFSLLRKVV